MSAMQMLWALPCTAVGAIFGVIAVCMGGSARRVDHTVEFALSINQAQVPAWVRRIRFVGITFGHVIVGQSHELLAIVRAHERVHVRQYERLGALFFIAYPAASLIAMLQGKSPYRDNYFERQACSEAVVSEDAV